MKTFTMKTFKMGGIHPSDNKLSSQITISNIPLPQSVTIFLSQHIGAPSKAVVKKGDMVQVGDLIGDSGGFISARVHSSVSGTVTSVDNMLDGAGVKKMAVTISVEGDEWSSSIDCSAEINRECTLSSKEIVDKILAMGVVGLGGATFPSHVKMLVPQGKKAEVLVVNGVECEPYLTSDHRLMLERAEEIIIGCEIVMRSIGVKKCYIGIENNKADAIDILRHYASEGIEVVALKLRYPQGGEKQLIDAVLGCRIPSGALPIEVGAVVQNVGTIFAIYQAVQKNKPLIDRVITVTGKGLKTPKNFMVRVGTAIDYILEQAGVNETDVALNDNIKIVNGGPMMGRAMSNINSPVTKGTSGILIMKAEETSRREATECISCAKCVEVCPMGLEPHLLNKIATNRLYDRLERERVMECIECGCCSYTCPARLPLLDYIRLGKAETSKRIRERSVK